MRKALSIVLLIAIFITGRSAFAQACVTASQATLTGNLRSANGLPNSNYTLSFKPSTQGYIAGCGVNTPQTFSCATSVDGSVVGLPNPTTASIVTTAGTGSLNAGTYYSVVAWYDASGNVTLVGPETATVLSATGSIVINPPASGIPAGATGMKVYISASPGAETLQGQTTGSGSYVQPSALTSGSTLPATNNTPCTITANDAVWPVGSGYVVSLTDSRGNSVPSYPMQWQLLGPGSTINLSNGLPYYHGVVQYPIPVLTSPTNHGQQYITGPLGLSGYNLLNVGKIGVGTSTPGWSIDVENGQINTNLGFSIGGTAPLHHFLCGNGSIYVDSATACVSSGGQPYYFIDQLNNIPLPQRGGNNFLSPLSAVDNPGGNTTNISVAPSGVTAGAYTNPSVTIDAYGRVTAAVSGNSIPVIQELQIASFPSCPTGNTAFATCSNVYSWTTPFADSGYALTCTPSTPSALTLNTIWWQGKTANGFTLVIQNADASGANPISLAEVDCIAIHP